MELEVISKIKKDDKMVQMQVINDFKNRIINYSKKKTELISKMEN